MEPKSDLEISCCSLLRAAYEISGRIPAVFSLCLNIMTDSRTDEETPLLHSGGDSVVNARKDPNEIITPLPKLQIAILLLAQLTEPICSQCIYPFTPQVIDSYC